MKTITASDGTVYHFDMTHEWKDLRVIEIEMPEGIDGTVVRWNNHPDEYRILINSNLSEFDKLKSFIHEMIHLYRKDLDKEGTSVNQIEAECHQITQEILKSISI